MIISQLIRNYFHNLNVLTPPFFSLKDNSNFNKKNGWTSLEEGGVRVRGDAVLRCFWCGFSEIFLLTCGIAVFQDCAVCGNLKF